MVRIAVLDDALARVLRTDHTQDVEVVWAGDALDRLLDEGARVAPDVVVLDVARLGPEAPHRIREVREALKARVVITTYMFARRADVEALRSAGSDFVLQGPLSVRTLRTFLLSLLIEGAMKRTPPSSSPPGASAAPPMLAPTATPGASVEAAPVTPPRFTRESLVRLREVQSAVACECPNHLADLVERLQAFEQYSKDCENRDDADARVHRSLWFSTARARRMMEDALVELARHEGLSIS